MPRTPAHLPFSEARPTLADLERYAQGRMGAAEQATLEACLAEDPLLADAVEGLMEVADQQRLRKRLNTLRKQTRHRVLLRQRKREPRDQRKRRVQPLWWPQAAVGIAAALALLVLVGVLLPRPGSESAPPPTPDAPALTQTEPTAPLPAPEPEALPDPLIAEAETRPSSSPTQRSAPPSIATPPKSAANAVAAAPAPQPAAVPMGSLAITAPTADSQRSPSVEAPAPLMAEEVGNNWTEAIAGEDTENEAGSLRHAAKAARQAQHMAEPAPLARDEMRDTAAAAPKALAQARPAHQRQEWATVRQSAQAALAQQPGQPEALFLLGDSYYRTGNAKAAIPLLQQVPSDAHPWYERAQWTLALAYQAQGQPALARQTLQRLSQRPGLYQAAARHLLDDLR